jgi:anti-anti-sigma factor
MWSQSQSAGLNVETIGDAIVVRFRHRSLLGDDLIEAIAADLRAVADEAPGRRLVLNVADVESMTTSMVGKLVALKQKVEAGGGRLEMCCVGPFLSQIFAVLNLADFFPVHPDEQTALAGG